MTPPVSLLNTRRIGGTARQVRLPEGVTPRWGDTGLPAELLGALKLTGQMNHLSYGIFGVVEDDVEWQGVDANGKDTRIRDDGRDFGIVRLSYEKSAGDRFALGYLGTNVGGPVYEATMHGIDVHYARQGGQWSYARPELLPQR